MKSTLAIFMIMFICAQPATARTEVSPPDSSSEDPASVALIGANLALAAQLSRHLQHDLPGGVFVTGALITALGTMQLTSGGDAADPHRSDDGLSRSLPISPLVTSAEDSGPGIGILTRVAF